MIRSQKAVVMAALTCTFFAYAKENPLSDIAMHAGKVFESLATGNGNNPEIAHTMQLLHFGSSVATAVGVSEKTVTDAKKALIANGVSQGMESTYSTLKKLHQEKQKNDELLQDYSQGLIAQNLTGFATYMLLSRLEPHIEKLVTHFSPKKDGEEQNDENHIVITAEGIKVGAVWISRNLIAPLLVWTAYQAIGLVR